MASVFGEPRRVRCQERTAPHAGINVTVLELLHLLCGDIIWNHSLRRAFCGEFCQIIILRAFADIVLIKYIYKLRERRGDPDSLLVLYALNALLQHFLNDQSKIIAQSAFRNLIEIHENGDKRCLPVGRHQSNDLILNDLHTAVDLLANAQLGNRINLFFRSLHTCICKFLSDLLAEFLTAHLNERNQM